MFTIWVHVGTEMEVVYFTEGCLCGNVLKPGGYAVIVKKFQDSRQPSFNTLRPRQNGQNFADDIFKYIVMNGNCYVVTQISLKFVPKDATDHEWALVQKMDWHQTGHKPLSGPMISCFTRSESREFLWIHRFCISIYILRLSITIGWLFLNKYLVLVINNTQKIYKMFTISLFIMLMYLSISLIFFWVTQLCWHWDIYKIVKLLQRIWTNK